MTTVMARSDERSEALMCQLTGERAEDGKVNVKGWVGMDSE